jgi:hypothetical protein
MNQRFREIASRHTGLIGNNHNLPFMLVEQSNGLTHPGKKGKSFDMVDISHFFINGSIPIEKDCPMCPAQSAYSPLHKSF